ncbi:MAG: HAD family hydrolase [Bacteriovoracaceae bacterium]
MDIDFKDFQAVFFDLDGTMINSEPIHFQAIVHIAKKGDPKDLEKKYNGHSDEEVYTALNLEMNYADFKALKEAKMREILKEIKSPEKYLNPGLKKVLEKIKAAGAKLGVVSASETESAIDLLETFALSSFFDHRVFRENTHLSKPNPSPYLKAMRDLKVSPDKTLVFEDSKVGIEAGILSGAKVIQVLTFHHPPTIDKRVDQISSFEELLNPHQA